MGIKISLSSIFVVLLLSIYVADAQVFDVTKYGAKADGRTDISQAVMTAFQAACASPAASKVLIPGGTYALNQLKLEGPCKGPVKLQVEGTLKASGDPSHFKNDGPGLPGWVTVQHIDQFSLMGGGIFDGQGAFAWTKNNCNQKFDCLKLPMSLVFNFITNAVIKDITSLNSKNFHVQIFGSKNVTVQHVTITAPGNSPNTDGIHLGRSTGINITDTNIGSGDDCISIGDGSKQISITRVTCGPGHGISVGSLGRYPNEEEVDGIFVRNCTLSKTMNGVRIKTWPSSPEGVAADMHFEDIIMDEVGNPVIIDQEYCPWGQCKLQAPSRVKISKVSFKNIRGTSTTQVAVKLVCSKSLPCQNVEIGTIDLAYHGPGGPAISDCKNVKPIFSGKQNPSVCTGSSQSS